MDLIPVDFHVNLLEWMAMKYLEFVEWVRLVIDEVSWF